jgi:hypothetical protein
MHGIKYQAVPIAKLAVRSSRDLLSSYHLGFFLSGSAASFAIGDRSCTFGVARMLSDRPADVSRRYLEATVGTFHKLSFQDLPASNPVSYPIVSKSIRSASSHPCGLIHSQYAFSASSGSYAGGIPEALHKIVMLRHSILP